MSFPPHILHAPPPARLSRHNTAGRGLRVSPPLPPGGAPTTFVRKYTVRGSAGRRSAPADRPARREPDMAEGTLNPHPAPRGIGARAQRRLVADASRTRLGRLGEFGWSPRTVGAPPAAPGPRGPGRSARGRARARPRGRFEPTSRRRPRPITRAVSGETPGFIGWIGPRGVNGTTPYRTLEGPRGHRLPVSGVRPRLAGPESSSGQELALLGSPGPRRSLALALACSATTCPTSATTCPTSTTLTRDTAFAASMPAIKPDQQRQPCRAAQSGHCRHHRERRCCRHGTAEQPINGVAGPALAPRHMERPSQGRDGDESRAAGSR